MAVDVPSVRPGTALEQIVAAAWHEALGVPPQGADEDFFAAGGHSLLAGEVAARLEQVLGIDVPLTMVFDHPTVGAQAAWLATVVTSSHPTGAPRQQLDGTWRTWLIPQEAARVLDEVARQQSTDALAALAALVAAAIARGAELVTIGVPVGGPVGCMIAPIAIDTSGDPSFLTLVDHARGALPRGLAAAAGFVPGGGAAADAVVELDGAHGGRAGAVHVAATRGIGGALALRVVAATPAETAALGDRLAALIAAIAPRPAIALSRLLPDGRAGAVPDAQPAVSPPLPLTHAQERLWFLETLTPNTTTNHIQRQYRVEGPLDLALLERALVALAARHPSLRTVFRADEGVAHQLVMRELALDHRVEQLGNVDASARADAVAARAHEDHARPFALDTGPLWRTRVCVFGPRDHALIFTIHHLIVDALSVIVWLRELAEHYHALATEIVPRLPQLGTSIAEIATWERSPEGRARGEADVAFWLTELAGARPLELPLDFRRPRGTGTGRHEVHELLGAERAADLRALGRRCGATLNVTLFAAAAAFLSRLTGQTDLVCVVPAARREEPGREAVIGLLLNLLPLRVRLDGDPSFAELIHRASRAMRDAIAHAESPYERIVAGLGLAREPGRQPLLDVIVNMVPGTELTRRGDLRFIVEAAANSAQPCDMVIGATTEQGGLLDLMIRCRDDVFAEITAHRMMRRFVTLLLAALDAPLLPLSELPVMPDDERALVTVAWNRTDTPLPDITVHDLVLERLARAPDAIAVIQGARSLTGGELAHRAARLARHLHARGVTPGTAVGVAIPPSPELAIAALGVMQAGAIYVPLDTTQPAARRDQLAREVAIVLEVTALAADGPALAPGCGPDDPAYLVFTSGSTGRPKGVATTHRALVNQILWFRRDVPWRPGEVACLRSSPAFVDSLWELFGPLADGVPLAIAEVDEMHDPRLLAAMAARHRVTRMVVVPSLLRTLLELGAPLPDLTLWLATSEELSPALVRAFREARPGDRLINLYGASETADQVAAYEVTGVDPLRTPIGKPIANARLYVVDAAGLALPIGVAGELCVAGVGVSAGYVGGEAAERFAPSAFVAGERVYRTGDRGRWRYDGTLEYLGRLDHLLKIRGVRVDPGEVEAAILTDPELAAAVVTGAPGFDGEVRLVAHVVPRGRARVDAAELRRRLRARLPETMIPTTFVALDALPLGPTGKVDRAALPPVAQLAVASRAPHGATEHAVALAWEHLLGRPVGAEDDFFAAGGQSLIAAQLGARLAERFGVELPLPVLFERPTVAAQAAWLDEATRLAGDTTIPRGAPGESAPLSFAQERLMFAAQLAPAAPAPKLRSALRIDGPLDIARLEQALALVADRQAALRTVFADNAQRVVARLPRDHRDVELSHVRQDARDDEVRAQLDDERERPFDLAAGPPWRTRLLRFGPETHVLVITMHHLVTDGISLGVWRDDLHEHYAALGVGRAPELPAITATAADVARWQRRAADSPISRRFWRETLAGATALDLPVAAPRTGWSAGRGGRVRAELDDDEAAALAALARTEQTSVFGVLLAGAGAWLHTLTASTDLTVGTIAAGRDRPEVRPLVGLFLNPLPLRLDASGDPSLRELVRRAGATTRAALAHGEVPFERIVADVNPERRAFRQPLFDVVLNHHPLADPPRLGDLRVRHVRGVTAPVAPYELMIRTIVRDTVARDRIIGSAGGSRRGITVQFDFQRDRFDEATVEAWLGRYLDVLRAMIATPERQLSTLRVT